ncbi:MAG: methyltransferase domain-containing protein [Chitinophagia bacterium]|nr:methyltransferase domain-containing protein [Chitinophagia bacterium]
MKEKNAYILGTELSELHRLGYQHQVWSSEARKAWEIAEFSYGQTILDLGCGPGFCTVELGYIVGDEGKVIAVDKSKAFLDYLDKLNESYALNIETCNTDFTNLGLEDDCLDGIYSRWALAWIKNPEETVQRLAESMRSGAVFVAQEYFDWSTFQAVPHRPALEKGIKSILRSFKEQEGDIDVGRDLSKIFYEAGLEIISTRPLTKYALPGDLNWYWPKTFLNIYMPKLEQAGYMTKSEIEDALDAFEGLEYHNDTVIFCPSMIEVIAVKP